MKIGLIGLTGYVGSYLYDNLPITNSYNSSTISTIRNESFDLLIIAAPKFKIKVYNKNPEELLEDIYQIVKNLKEVTAKRVIVISHLSANKNMQNDKYGQVLSVLNNSIFNMFPHVTIKFYEKIARPDMPLRIIVPEYLEELEEDFLKDYYDYSEEYKLFVKNNKDSEELEDYFEKKSKESYNFYINIDTIVDYIKKEIAYIKIFNEQ